MWWARKSKRILIRDSDKIGWGIIKDIIDVLQANQTYLNTLSFQAHEFASCISEEFNGTQKKMYEIINHDVFHDPWQDHQLIIAFEHCISDSCIVSDLLNALQEIFFFFQPQKDLDY